jgi:hypothetical protein
MEISLSQEDSLYAYYHFFFFLLRKPVITSGIVLMTDIVNLS